jgi:hypothetical protein
MFAPPVRKKRRWWFYAGVVFAGLILVTGALVVAGVQYWNSLVATYTETQPKPLPPMDDSPAAGDRLKGKWAAFANELEAGRIPPSLSFSADDLNVFIAENMPQLTDRLRLTIAGDRLKGQFSVPLGQTGQRKLMGRYLNGVVTFDLAFQPGWLDLRAVAVEANGKPIPRWILRHIRKRNVLEKLHESFQATELLQKLESVQVKDDQITLTPGALQ